nr:MAG TPA: hypothetical protein [Caudoviricetes sp.]
MLSQKYLAFCFNRFFSLLFRLYHHCFHNVGCSCLDYCCLCSPVSR